MKASKRTEMEIAVPPWLVHMDQFNRRKKAFLAIPGEFGGSGVLFV